MLPKDLRSDMTVINVVETPDGVKLYPTVLQWVFWQNNYAADLASQGIVTQDRLLVIIPYGVNSEGKIYVGANKYESLQDKSAVWTIRKNDRFLQGRLPDVDPLPSLTELARMGIELFTISEFAENLFGAKKLHHFKIIGR